MRPVWRANVIIWTIVLALLALSLVGCETTTGPTIEKRTHEAALVLDVQELADGTFPDTVVVRAHDTLYEEGDTLTYLLVVARADDPNDRLEHSGAVVSEQFGWIVVFETPVTVHFSVDTPRESGYVTWP